jgi:hypothetical protein
MLSFPSTVILSITVLGLLAFVKADYIIDDSNSTITYTGKWLVYPPTSFSFLDETQLYNATVYVDFLLLLWIKI